MTEQKCFGRLFPFSFLHLIIITAKVTNPALEEEDWEAIVAFCDQVNHELEGPQFAIRLLAHKIQSPTEREALYALSVSVSINFFLHLCFVILCWCVWERESWLFCPESHCDCIVLNLNRSALFYIFCNFPKLFGVVVLFW